MRRNANESSLPSFFTMINHLMAHDLISFYLPENADLKRDRYHP